MISAIFSIKPAQFGSGPFKSLHHSKSPRTAFTLVEMLVAISITLVMMATVVGVFATVSSSVSKRRAAVEVGNQLRHVRNVLQRDLEGATCPAIPWQKPESDVGYFEVVEGLHADFFPSSLTDVSAAIELPGEIDHAASTVPSSNLPLPDASWVTDGGGLGDHDDILAFTSRNEKDPFTGPAPAVTRQSEPGSNPSANSDFVPKDFREWRSQTIKSPVAEVVWYCVENPSSDNDPRNFFGEPGMRTIYRRTLLVAPWLDYRFNVDQSGPKSRPGVLRVIDRANINEAQALACLIAFQERYDISARIEFDPTIDAPDGRWTIVANTLADLTDRKNRYEHHGFVGDPNNGARVFGYTMMSAGNGGVSNVSFAYDPEYGQGGNFSPARVTPLGGRREPTVLGYQVDDAGSGYLVRPFACLNGGATARAVVSEAGEVVYVTKGLVPLGLSGPNQSRRGADLMMSDALAFDIQVYDPEAPVYAIDASGQTLQSSSAIPNPNADLTAVSPADVGWALAQATNNPLPVSSGSYVDLGYGALHGDFMRRSTGSTPSFAWPTSPFAGLPHARAQLGDLGFTRTYDTWNFAYENDGVNQDGDVDSTGNPIIDEGTNGLDDRDPTLAGDPNMLDHAEDFALFGPDDVSERETSPPYPVPLRAVQVKLRVYELDSHQIREVTVRQHFVPE